MKKAILTIACLAVIFISLSAFTGRTSAPVRGYLAPVITLANDSATITLGKDTEKGYVLLSFWNSSDASSRLKCNSYAALAETDDNLSLVAVNFDGSDALYHEVIRRDRLDPSSQYRVEGVEATKIQELYHLSDGLKSFLINPEGRIIAVNPDTRMVRNLLN